MGNCFMEIFWIIEVLNNREWTTVLFSQLLIWIGYYRNKKNCSCQMISLRKHTINGYIERTRQNDLKEFAILQIYSARIPHTHYDIQISEIHIYSRFSTKIVARKRLWDLNILRRFSGHPFEWLSMTFTKSGTGR